MFAALAGALFAAGLLVLLRGIFPQRRSLANQLAVFSDGSVNVEVEDNLFEFYSLKLLETVKGDQLEAYESDVIVSGSDLPSTAVDKSKSALVAGIGLAGASIFMGIVSSPMGLLITTVIGAALGYIYPDFKLKKVAAARRVEFSQTLTGFMTLLSSSISGGGGLTTAIDDAAAMGDGWVFDHIKQALAEARLDGTSAWVALERLGEKLGVVPLIEIAGSLTLAGSSGARVTETLVSRAHSSRQKELAEARSDAESKSAKLGGPVAMILTSWMAFVVYPAISGLSF
jgi:Flp pilus assembly protein TadB